ncbi:MAG: hypothetical protein ACK4UP_09400 [Spirosomataceae bacterium]
MKKIFTLAIFLLIAENSFAIGFPSNNVYIHHKLNSQKMGSKQRLISSKELNSVDKTMSVYKQVATEEESKVVVSTEEQMSLMQVIGAFVVQLLVRLTGIRF